MAKLSDKDLPGRLKAARAAAGLSQKDLADKTGIPIDSLKKYERGASTPGAEALTAYATAGINVMFLLIGDGDPTVENRHREAHTDAMRDVLLNDPLARKRQDERLARIGAVTRAVISGVNEALEELRLTMSEEKKTELISTLMELYLDSQTEPQRGTILRLVKSAA